MVCLFPDRTPPLGFREVTSAGDVHQGAAWLITVCVPKSGDSQHSAHASLTFGSLPSYLMMCSLSSSNSMATEKGILQGHSKDMPVPVEHELCS